jgi:hypothetical protein
MTLKQREKLSSIDLCFLNGWHNQMTKEIDDYPPSEFFGDYFRFVRYGSRGYEMHDYHAVMTVHSVKEIYERIKSQQNELEGKIKLEQKTLNNKTFTSGVLMIMITLLFIAGVSLAAFDRQGIGLSLIASAFAVEILLIINALIGDK